MAYRWNKYGNRREDGFDSKKERARYNELILLQSAGKIHGLQRQVKFRLIDTQKVNGKVVERPCDYRADFTYWEPDKNGISRFVVEDVKGHRTKDYIIKRKLMLKIYGYQIRET